MKLLIPPAPMLLLMPQSSQRERERVERRKGEWDEEGGRENREGVGIKGMERVADMVVGKKGEGAVRGTDRGEKVERLGERGIGPKGLNARREQPKIEDSA
jgi:hypothetical protein